MNGLQTEEKEKDYADNVETVLALSVQNVDIIQKVIKKGKKKMKVFDYIRKTEDKDREKNLKDFALCMTNLCIRNMKCICIDQELPKIEFDNFTIGSIQSSYESFLNKEMENDNR